MGLTIAKRTRMMRLMRRRQQGRGRTAQARMSPILPLATLHGITLPSWSSHMSLVIGIDIGTSGVRAMAVDERGLILGEARTPLPPPERVGSLVTQDPFLWWAAADAALHALCGQIDPARVRALAIDGTSGTMVAIDAAGQPVGPGRM